MKKINYDMQKFIIVNGILGERKYVRIAGEKKSRKFGAAIITEYKAARNKNMNFIDTVNDEGNYNVNTEELRIDDVVKVCVQIGSTNKYCDKWEIFFVVRKIEQDGIVIEEFPTLYQAIKG